METINESKQNKPLATKESLLEVTNKNLITLPSILAQCEQQAKNGQRSCVILGYVPENIIQEILSKKLSICRVTDNFNGDENLKISW
jgi:hypothetical protein